MRYVEPQGTILDVVEQGDVTTIRIRFDRTPSSPVAPARLYLDPKTGSERFQLHRFIALSHSEFTFETFNRTLPLPQIGDALSWRGWWLPKAMEAALDTEANWNRREYPDNGNHDHCLFTWENIASYADISEGYHSDRYGWITCQAYRQFVEGDQYQLRREDSIRI